MGEGNEMKTCGCLHLEVGPNFINYAYLKNDEWVCNDCSLPFSDDSPILKKIGAPVPSNKVMTTINVQWKKMSYKERVYHKVPGGFYWVMRIGRKQAQLVESIYYDYLTNIFRTEDEGGIYDVIWYAPYLYPDPPKGWL